MKNQRKTSNIQAISLSAVSVAILSVCSWIYIPLFGPFVPFTMQTFAVLLIAGLFDLKIALSSVLTYLLLGAVGVPVFTGFKGGIGVFLGPTGGYIVGFVICVIIVGLFKFINSNKTIVIFISMSLGVMSCYIFGTVWFYVAYANMGKESSILGILTMCVFPFIIPDVAKIMLAAVLVKRLAVPLKKLGIKSVAQNKK